MVAVGARRLSLLLPLLLLLLAHMTAGTHGARAALRKAVPTYNLPVRGISPYNNHDP